MLSVVCVNRPVALPVACKHPPHLPSCACRPPFRHHCRHHHLRLNASMTGTTSLTLSPYNRRHLTSPHRQGVQKVRWPPPFPQDPHLLTLPLCVGHSTHVAAPVAPQFTRPAPHPIPPRPPSSPACWGVQKGQRTPSPLFPGYAARKGKGCVQGEGEGPGGMHTRGRAACKGRWRVCERASERGCA